MSTDVLTRFRRGVTDETFTLTQLSKLSGIPISTLSDMAAANWRPQIFDKLEKLSAALDAIENKPTKTRRRAKTSSKKGGTHATA